ncbi:MAG: YraN family protein [Thiohalomonadaceae bacterium]|jgi:putative endonuclease
MIDRNALGQDAEQMACAYLQERGLTLIQRNYHSRRGELDLVMRDGDTTVFVEVRYRRPSAFVSALASVDRHKQAKLVATAQHYLLQYPAAAQSPCRFDIIAITPKAGKNQIEWLTNAFEA